MKRRHLSLFFWTSFNTSSKKEGKAILSSNEDKESTVTNLKITHKTPFLKILFFKKCTALIYN